MQEQQRLNAEIAEMERMSFEKKQDEERQLQIFVESKLDTSSN